ncbi:hypothetical protein MTO96_023280 [Rhipicephalus appendiculatus]
MECIYVRNKFYENKWLGKELRLDPADNAKREREPLRAKEKTPIEEERHKREATETGNEKEFSAKPEDLGRITAGPGSETFN